MVAVLRTLAAVAVIVIPGAFAILLAYFAARMLRRSYLEARQRAHGAEVHLRDIIGAVSVRSLVQEAKALGL